MNDKTSVRDLIDLPGPFAFKIIVKSDQIGSDHIIEVAMAHLGRDLGEHQLTARASAKANYRAYTLQVHINEYEEIEGLYQAYRLLDGVVMVL